MGKSDHLILGQWNALCDRCGFKFKSRQIRMEWTGLRVCAGPGTNDCWEPRHPQEFLRGRKDDQAPPWSRPDDGGDEPFVNEGGTDITPDDL